MRNSPGRAIEIMVMLFGGIGREILRFTG